MMKNEDEAWDIIDTLSENDMHHASTYPQRCQPLTNVLVSTEEWEEMKLAVQQLQVTYANPFPVNYFDVQIEQELTNSTLTYHSQERSWQVKNEDWQNPPWW